MVRNIASFVTFVLLSTGLCPAVLASSDNAAQLQALLQQKKYVELERSINLRLSAQDAALFRGIVANRKNRVEESIKLLEPLAARFAARPPSWREKELLKTLADDYSKTFAYAKSADEFSALLKRYGPGLSARERRSAGDRRDEMLLLRSAPPQTAELNGPATVPATRNALGLIEIPVEANGTPESWVLDTGANTSVITESAARRIGLQLLEGTAKTDDAVGLPVSYRVGVLPQLKIGNAVFHNVEIPVASDQALNIAGCQIQGIIGFGVQTALGRITFYADGRVGINTEPANETGSALFMDEQTPVAVVKAAGADRLFSLDTGAGGSSFGVRFYQAVKSQLNESMRAKMESAGAGGSRSFHGYIMKDLKITLGGQEVTLSNASILDQSTGSGLDVFFGNLGQDVFGAFKSYTIDFQNMTFTALK